MQKRDNDQCPDAGLQDREMAQTEAHRAVSLLHWHLGNISVLCLFLAISTKDSASLSGLNLDRLYLPQNTSLQLFSCFVWPELA